MSGVQAFVDESVRGGRYLLCIVVVEPSRAGALRREVRSLVMPGQRVLLFKKESARRRRELLAALGRLDVEATVYECAVEQGRGQEDARAMCMARGVADLQDRGCAVTMVIESRENLDANDRVTILRARVAVPPLTFEHVAPTADPLLWLPDCFAWPVGARGEWLRRVQPALTGGIIRVG